MAALADGAEICLFCRPDLTYHDSLLRPVRRAVAATVPTVFLPYWQAHGGQNDRFAICSGTEAITAYGQRIRYARQFCAETSKPLNSEHLLAYSLARAEIDICRIGNRASRTRLDGTRKYEDFSRPWVSRLKTQVRPKVIRVTDELRLRQTVRALLKRIRP